MLEEAVPGWLVSDTAMLQEALLQAVQAQPTFVVPYVSTGFARTHTHTPCTHVRATARYPGCIRCLARAPAPPRLLTYALLTTAVYVFCIQRWLVAAAGPWRHHDHRHAAARQDTQALHSRTPPARAHAGWAQACL